VLYEVVCFSAMAALILSHTRKQASGSWTGQYLQGKSFLSFFHSFARVCPSSTQQLGNFFFHVIVRRELGSQGCSGAAAYNLIATRFELQGRRFPVCLYVALPVSAAVSVLHCQCQCQLQSLYCIASVSVSCSPCLLVHCIASVSVSCSPCLPVHCIASVSVSCSPCLPVHCIASVSVSRSPCLPVHCIASFSRSCFAAVT